MFLKIFTIPPINYITLLVLILLNKYEFSIKSFLLDFMFHLEKSSQFQIMLEYDNYFEL
jgi:hypothetical protein